MADNAVAYGFISLKNVWSDRITTIGGESIADAVAQSLAEYNRQADALMGDMVSGRPAPTTWASRSRAAQRRGATTGSAGSS
jgi:hypothetical protein